MESALNVTLIYGSARPGRRCDTVAEWAADTIRRSGDFALDVVDPAEPGIAAAISGADPAALSALRARLDAADAFVVVTPEYNRSYPAALKAVIDAAKQEWEAKPVAFVSYGGISGGLRAVEHLRNVFTELHATSIRDGVSFANVWEAFDAAGEPVDRVGPSVAMGVMLSRLRWWASALRQARLTQAYREVAA